MSPVAVAFCSWCVERPEDGPCDLHPAGFVDDLVDLVALQLESAETDRAAAADTSLRTIQAAIVAHDRLDEACEDFRQAYRPETDRVIAALGEVWVISRGGRTFERLYPDHALVGA